MDLSFATVDPIRMRDNATGCTAFAMNLSGGEFWVPEHAYRRQIPDPLTGETLYSVPNTPQKEFQRFIKGLASCPSYGLHNPLLNIERYLLFGSICAKAAAALTDPVIADFFAHLIQRVMPKSLSQCMGEVTVTRDFLYNFAGDNPRFHFGGSTSTSGNHAGQENRLYRYPFGPSIIISPFNFPLEIPALQLVGALLTGNRPLLKADSKVSIVAEQFVRLLISCGLPPTDMDLIHCSGENMRLFLTQAKNHIAFCQFTGSSEVAEWIKKTLPGRVKVEDSGFDWKVLGPDITDDMLPYIAWQSDQDAYAAAGQKCSAQSLLFVHENCIKIFETMRALAKTRTLENLTNGPLLSIKNQDIEEHIAKIVKLMGAHLLWGGKPLTGHTIPSVYGAFEPTAIAVPIYLLINPAYFELTTKEIFGPLQIITTYGDRHLDLVLRVLEKIPERLTAAIVSNDQTFISNILGKTTNGTTYVGLRARTTGAPQNHWFGPCSPCAAGIGTPEAIRVTWTANRKISWDTILPKNAAPGNQT